MPATAVAPEPIADKPWAVRTFRGGRIWIERAGAPHANDAMVLERAALALDILVASRLNSPVNPLAVAIDHDQPLPDRIAALHRLGVSPHDRVRLIVLPTEIQPEASPSVAHPTDRGLVRIALDDRHLGPQAAAGIGRFVPAELLPDSLSTAIAAYFLTTTRTPVVEADSLGDLLDVVLEALASGVAANDIASLQRLDEEDLLIAEALASETSLRAAARQAGRHHSSVQARYGDLVDRLGWDLRSPYGRARFLIAELCLRLM
jgi:hypothetical protein